MAHRWRTVRSRERLRVVDFGLVRDDVCVDAARRRDAVVADCLTDLRLRDPLEVQERDAAVTEVMRREHRDACGSRSASEAVCGDGRP